MTLAKTGKQRAAVRSEPSGSTDGRVSTEAVVLTVGPSESRAADKGTLRGDERRRERSLEE